MDFADAHRRAWEHQDHKRHAWDILMEQSENLSCGRRGCIYALKDSSQPSDCECHRMLVDREFFTDLANYIKGNFESIIPLATSKALADERFYRLMCPKDDK